MNRTRREFVQSAGLGGLALVLAGCDEGKDALAKLIVGDERASFAPPHARQIDEAMHVINRLTFGARPGDHARVTSMGVDAFINEQLNPERLDDRRCEWKVAEIESLAEPTPELYEHHPGQLLADLQRAKLLRAVYSRRQLQEVMVDFWTDHFNIVSEKGDCKWLKAADDRDVIRRHALGTFADLVRASAVSPAMLIYLDGHDNKVCAPGERPNENYARELLELHTLGVHGGYTQEDVMETARCLSGWRFDRSRWSSERVQVPINDILPDAAAFELTLPVWRQAHASFDLSRHDNGEKHVLGNRIAAGGGERDLDAVVEIVCEHPSTAKHVATKLCRRFIADPIDSVDGGGKAVEATAGAFAESHGDIRSTLRALFDSGAFVHARGNLLKRPWHFVASTLRGTEALTDGGEPVQACIRRLGHAPHEYPTPDGYPLEAQPWLGGLLWRWNFAIEACASRLKGTRISFDELAQACGGIEGVAAHMLGRAASVEEIAAVRSTRHRLALLLCSPAFQRF